jgi:hypothetical protein
MHVDFGSQYYAWLLEVVEETEDGRQEAEDRIPAQYPFNSLDTSSSWSGNPDAPM